MTVDPKSVLNYRTIMAIIHPDQDYKSATENFDINAEAIKSTLRKMGHPENIRDLYFNIPKNNYQIGVLAAHFVKGIIRPGFKGISASNENDAIMVRNYYMSVWNLFSTFKNKDNYRNSQRFSFFLAESKSIIMDFTRKLGKEEDFGQSIFDVAKELEKRYPLKKKIGRDVESMKKMIDQFLNPPVEVLKKYLVDNNKIKALKDISESEIGDAVLSTPNFDEIKKTIDAIKKRPEEPYIISAQIALQYIMFIFQTLNGGTVRVDKNFVNDIMKDDPAIGMYSEIFD